MTGSPTNWYFFIPKKTKLYNVLVNQGIFMISDLNLF